MAIKPVVCGGTEVYVPECDPCDMFEERVEALEECCDEAQATLADHEQRITTNEADIASIKQNFANYYTKSETYTKAEVNNLIEQIETVTIVRVMELPATGENNKIYLVPKSGSSPDVHDEYIWSNNAWEKIGDTQIDLSNYYNKTETDTLLDTKQNKLTAGTNVQISGSTISATDTNTWQANTASQEGYVKAGGSNRYGRAWTTVPKTGTPDWVNTVSYIPPQAANVSYADVGVSVDADICVFLEAWLKYVVANYADSLYASRFIVAIVRPNSQGYVWGYCYSDTDGTGGLPKYSSFTYTSNSGNIVRRFGTSNSVFWCQNGGASDNDITNITKSGNTFTVTRRDGTTYTLNDNDSVTGVKGQQENSYRTGNVNVTPANVLYLGTNPTGSAANDTADFWNSKGPGYAYFSATGMLDGQPSQWGLLENVMVSGFIQQFYYTSGGAVLKRRSNGSTGGLTEWVTVDNNTTYTAGTGLSLSGTQFSLNTTYLINQIHPVGDTIIRLDNTNPSTLYPGTTWEKISEGKVLIGANSTYTLGSSATGSMKHSHTNPTTAGSSAANTGASNVNTGASSAANTGGTTLTAAQSGLPAHSHPPTGTNTAFLITTQGQNISVGSTKHPFASGSGGEYFVTGDQPGSTHGIVEPVNTANNTAANASSAHSHTMAHTHTLNSHTHTMAHTHTQGNTGDATIPYLAVNIWRRTA